MRPTVQRRSTWRRFSTNRKLFSIIVFLCLSFFVVIVMVSFPSPEDRLCLTGSSDQLDVAQSLRGPAARLDAWRVTSLSCVALMEGDEAEKNKAKLYMNFHPYRPIYASQLTREIEDSGCETFKRTRHYDIQPISNEELEFPVAFSILVHRDVDQVERLLNTIHRPHNSYCIHVDAKAPDDIMRAIRSIASCFSNVFIPPKLEAITYAHFSRLQADLSCMQELLIRGRTWKYVINLTGQMFPLKTNLEIVKILRTYEGSNDIEGLSRYVSIAMKVRYKNKFVISKNKLIDSHIPKDPPPHGINLVKGSAYGAFSRPFVEYALSDRVVQDFLNWTMDIYSPDEIFWASLNSRWVNPMFKSPGGHDLPPERKPWMATYAAWRKRDGCGGIFVRDVCIFGVADLPSLISRKEMFANKFYVDFQYLTTDCLREWLENKTKHQLPIDLEFYKNIKKLLRSNG